MALQTAQAKLQKLVAVHTDHRAAVVQVSDKYVSLYHANTDD